MELRDLELDKTRNTLITRKIEEPDKKYIKDKKSSSKSV